MPLPPMNIEGPLKEELPLLNRQPAPPRETQRDLEPSVPVRVRLVWPHGEEIVEATAEGWSGRIVRVCLPRAAMIRRLRTPFVWLPASDVERM